jgi:hypothetical protein
MRDDARDSERSRRRARTSRLASRGGSRFSASTARSAAETEAATFEGMAADSEVGRSAWPLLSVRQVAKMLGVCPATVYRLCDRGELPHFRVLNATWIDPGDLKSIVARGRRRSLGKRATGLADGRRQVAQGTCHSPNLR